MKSNIANIHDSFEDYSNITRSEIGIEFLVRNIKSKGYTLKELKDLCDYFEKCMFPEYNQTS